MLSQCQDKKRLGKLSTPRRAAIALDEFTTSRLSRPIAGRFTGLGVARGTKSMAANPAHGIAEDKRGRRLINPPKRWNYE